MTRLGFWFSCSDHWGYYTGRFTTRATVWSCSRIAYHRKIKEIHITRFHSRDVVRHQLVQKIVEAYEGWDSEQYRLSAEARAERKARQEALISENDSAADAQHEEHTAANQENV